MFKTQSGNKKIDNDFGNSRGFCLIKGDMLKQYKRSCKPEYQRFKISKLIENILSTSGVEGLYDLEFANIQPNPVVYSRFGRASYNSKEKSKLEITFDAKDLQEIISNKMKLKPSSYKWSFMDPHCKIQEYYQPSDLDKTLIFESRFESGNLGIA